MSSDQFSQTEDRFFQLKGQLETGRITREQFEEALKALIVRDGQGRYWMLGADTGKWYLHDGTRWIEAQPPSARAPSAPPVWNPPPPPSAPNLPPPTGTWSALPPAPPPVSRGSTLTVVFAVLGIGVVALLCVATVLVFAMSQGALKISFGAATSTPLPPLPTIPPATVAVPAIASPAIVVVTAVPQPTIATLPSPTAPVITSTTQITLPVAATAVPLPPAPATATVPIIPPTEVPPTAVPETPTPQLAPGIYVAGIVTDPPEVKAGQYPSFRVTFINSLGYAAHYNWYVKIYEPEARQSFGETAKAASEIPAGSIVLSSAANWKAAGGTPCRQLIARVFYVAPDNTIFEFPKPGGDSFWYYFQGCD